MCSRDFGRAEFDILDQALERTVRLASQVAGAFPVLQFKPHLNGLDARVHPHDQQVVEHIGALADQATPVTGHCFNEAFDSLFTEFPGDLLTASA
jgi:hypothetical protein